MSWKKRSREEELLANCSCQVPSTSIHLSTSSLRLGHSHGDVAHKTKLSAYITGLYSAGSIWKNMQLRLFLIINKKKKRAEERVDGDVRCSPPFMFNGKLDMPARPGLGSSSGPRHKNECRGQQELRQEVDDDFADERVREVNDAWIIDVRGGKKRSPRIMSLENYVHGFFPLSLLSCSCHFLFIPPTHEKVLFIHAAIRRGWD